MTTESEAADIMTRQALKITEGAVNITAASVKHLAAFTFALAKQPGKLIGKKNATFIIKESQEKNRPLAIYQLRPDDLKSFTKEAKRLGVTFTAMKDKNNPGVLDVLSFMDQAPLVNRIFEKMGYMVPQEAGQEDGQPKNAQNRRSRSNSESREPDNTSRSSSTRKTMDEKPSVKERVETIKKDQRRQNKKPKTKEKEK